MIAFNNQVHGLYMTFLERLERRIRANFPELPESEISARLSLAKHLIAMEHEKKNNERNQSQDDVI